MYFAIETVYTKYLECTTSSSVSPHILGENNIKKKTKKRKKKEKNERQKKKLKKHCKNMGQTTLFNKPGKNAVN